MKDKDLEFSHDSTTNIFDWSTMNTKETCIEVPFSATFSYGNKWIGIQLVNGSDVFKLADIFAEMLKKNDIDFTVSKYGNTEEK